MRNEIFGAEKKMHNKLKSKLNFVKKNLEGSALWSHWSTCKRGLHKSSCGMMDKQKGMYLF
jgi:hypothetical protein